MITFDGKNYAEDQFLDMYLNQKEKENDEKDLRVRMEMALLEKYGNTLEESQMSGSLKVGRFHINIKRNITYKLSEKGWQLINELPEAERPVDIKYNHTKGKIIPAIAMEEIPNETKPTFTVVYK